MKGIYKIVNIVTNKVYIGQTKRDIEKRWKEHINELNKNIHNNLHLQRSWNKYGKENFVFDIIEINEDNDKIDRLEMFYINQYDSFVNGYNMNLGGKSGNLGYKHTEESLLKMKNAMTGKKHTEETKKLMSDKAIGTKKLMTPNAYLYPKEIAYKVKIAVLMDMKPTDICDLFNVTESYIKDIKRLKIWSSILNQYNTLLKSKQRKRTKITKQIIEKVLELRNNGCIVKEICKTLILSYNAVNKILKSELNIQNTP